MDAELAAMGSGTVQLNSFLWNTRLGRHVKAGEGEETMELLLPNAARRDDSPKVHFCFSNQCLC